MKGNPDVPQCGFSRIVVQIFYALGEISTKNYTLVVDRFINIHQVSKAILLMMYYQIAIFVKE